MPIKEATAMDKPTTITLPTLSQVWHYAKPAGETLILLVICIAIGYIGILAIRSVYHDYEWKRRPIGWTLVVAAFVLFIIGNAWIYS